MKLFYFSYVAITLMLIAPLGTQTAANEIELCYDRIAYGSEPGSVENLMVCEAIELADDYERLCLGIYVTNTDRRFRALQYRTNEAGAWSTISHESMTTANGFIFSADQSVLLGSRNISEIEVDNLNKSVNLTAIAFCYPPTCPQKPPFILKKSFLLSKVSTEGPRNKEG
jgi:hypothetical protein